MGRYADGMSENGIVEKSDKKNEEKNSGEARTEEAPPPTPFDHPLFLPVLLLGGMLWFGYDGWIETDPEMLEHRGFNRIGFAVLSILTMWFGYKGVTEWKQEKEEAERAADPAADRDNRPPPIA